MQSLIPLKGDNFMGEAGADLNGSKVLTNWVKKGDYWTSSGDPAQNNPDTKFTCQSPTAACTYPQSLYLNNNPLVHQLALPIASGQWYFDYEHDLVYMADDPTGQTVELSVTPYAFVALLTTSRCRVSLSRNTPRLCSMALSNLRAPVGSIKNNVVRLNNGEGIKTFGSDEQVLSNTVDTNGELGMGAGGGTGDTFELNTVSGNNFAKIHFGVEMGGCKFSATINTQVIKNTVSNNDGNGIWFDQQATGE